MNPTQKWFLHTGIWKVSQSLKNALTATGVSCSSTQQDILSQMQCLYSVTQFNSFSRCHKNFWIQYEKFGGLRANFKNKKSQLLLYSIHSLDAATTVWQEMEWALSLQLHQLESLSKSRQGIENCFHFYIWTSKGFDMYSFTANQQYRVAQLDTRLVQWWAKIMQAQIINILNGTAFGKWTASSWASPVN